MTSLLHRRTRRLLHFALALLVALSPSPAGATAGTGVPAGEGAEISSAPADPYGDSARSAEGMEFPWSFETREGGSAGGSQRTGSSPTDSLYLPSGYEAYAAHARRLQRDRRRGDDDGVVPLCERLPYFATAPPSSR